MELKTRKQANSEQLKKNIIMLNIAQDNSYHLRVKLVMYQ